MSIIKTIDAAASSESNALGHSLTEEDRRAKKVREVATGAIAAIFWLGLLGIGTFLYLRTEKADVLLNVASVPDNDVTVVNVTGRVVLDGRPVDNGSVQVVVNDADRRRYLTSADVTIESNTGAFTSNAMRLNVPLNSKLEVGANYTGTVKLSDGAMESVTGTASAYVNMQRPLDRNSLAWLGGLALFLLLVLIVLFTGELTAPKARALFAATYLMTFVSLAIPIAVAVSLTSNESLVNTMRNAPIGLVRATTQNVRDEQWMLNLGGTVVLVPRQGDFTAGTPAVILPATIPGAQPNQAGGDGPPSSAPLDSPPAVDSVSLIQGGIAVPFYILMLAMLGAGINMTRQVPKVQTIYDQKITPRRESFLIATIWSLLQVQIVVDKNEREAAAVVRKHLIDSYMYLLAAPFLAIAVYYLLQVVANDTAEPVLVLMAFATGLISDAIVTRIMDFAEKTIGKVALSGDEQAAAPQQSAAPPPSSALARAAAITVPAPASAATEAAVAEASVAEAAVAEAAPVPASAPAAPAATPAEPAAESASPGTSSQQVPDAGSLEKEAERVVAELVLKVEGKNASVADAAPTSPTERTDTSDLDGRTENERRKQNTPEGAAS